MGNQGMQEMTTWHDRPRAFSEAGNYEYSSWSKQQAEQAVH
jgi:hypothetical protein